MPFHLEYSQLYACDLVYVLYKTEKPFIRPSVCLYSFLVRLLTLRRSTSDLLDVIAMSSGITEFVFTSLQFFRTSVRQTPVLMETAINHSNPVHRW